MPSKTFWLRLRHASLPEMVYRLRKERLKRRLKNHHACGGTLPLPAPPELSLAAIAKLKLPEMVLQGGDQLIRKLLGGYTFTLNADPAALAAFEEACRGRFFGDISLQQSGVDIRQVWEPARLQQAMLLLVFARQKPEHPLADPAREKAVEAVLRWIERHPFACGPHYLSAMECGLRIPVFICCLQSLPAEAVPQRRSVIAAIHAHAWWIERSLALFSSLGNHTVAECLGLVFAGGLFAGQGEGRRWLATGHKWLQRELFHQVLADGGPAEQSLSYHRMVLDMLRLAADLLQDNALADCGDWYQRLDRGESFWNAFQDRHVPLSGFGDSDDGQALAPGLWPLRSGGSSAPCALQTFPDSGYSLVRRLPDAVLVFDHGPLGMAPLYNHGHADALAVTLTVQGRPILVDIGTFAYNGQPPWRHYFKGTRGHNTVTIDGQDQAVQASGFIWSSPYATELLRANDTDGQILLEAVHHGYRRLSEPVSHRRKIAVYDEDLILIRDEFDGQGTHSYEINFHLHPEVSVADADADGWQLVSHGPTRVFLCLIEGGRLQANCGELDPPRGWYSAAYGHKQPTTVLSCKAKGPARATCFVTAIALGRPATPERLLEKLALFRRAEG